MATPQDNIIETLEAEIIRLKTELTHTEDRLSEMRKNSDIGRVLKMTGKNSIEKIILKLIKRKKEDKLNGKAKEKTASD